MHSLYTFRLFTLCATLVAAQNLSESYAPVHVECPSNHQFVRRASEGLGPDEERWLRQRKQAVAGALPRYLSRANMSNFDIDGYISALNRSNYAAVPTIGLAVSGGGWASALMGSGIIRALDEREDASNAAGTGGLLQSMSFFSGQSGGSWVVMSYSTAQYPLSKDLLDYWQPQIQRGTAKTNGTHAATAASLLSDVIAKEKAGFSVGIADLLGRTNGYEFIEGPHGGLNVTFSGITKLPAFKSHQMPLPIVQITQVTDADTNELGLLVPGIDSPIYEMTPYEFGSWMQPVASFMDMEYLGTTMINGEPVNTSACVQGFDRADWVIGASADAYEFWYLESKSNNTLGQFPKRSDPTTSLSQLKSSRIHGLAKRLSPEFPPAEVEAIESSFQEAGLSLEDFTYAKVPNPFRTTSNSSEETFTAKELKMVDATEVESSLPLAGQLARNATFIIAWDDNTDAYPNGWENGTDLYQAYLYFQHKGIPFPIVPSPSTFIARNYTVKPAFFGCSADLTTTNDTRAPIVAWFGNAPYSSYSNITFFQSATPVSRVKDLWNNTFNQITQGAGSLDLEWSACLACAAIDRTLTRLDPPIQRTAQCEGCFARYCWDGTSEPEYGYHVDVNPSLRLDPGMTYAEWNATVGATFQ